MTSSTEQSLSCIFKLTLSQCKHHLMPKLVSFSWQIYYDNEVRGPMCGDSQTDLPASFSTSGNIANVTFHSDQSVQRMGFRARYDVTGENNNLVVRFGRPKRIALIDLGSSEVVWVLHASQTPPWPIVRIKR